MQSNKQIAMIFILILTAVAQADQTHCVDPGKIRYREGRQWKELPMSYCVRLSQAFFLDKKCHLTQNCLALQQAIEIPDSETKLLQVGNPNFRRCMQRKATPRFIDYFDKGDWVPVTVCQFSDNSMVGLDYMIRTRYK